LLVVLTARKVQDLVKHEMREKRGGGLGNGHQVGDRELEAVLGHEPSPEFSAMVAENCERLLDLLEPAERQIALLRLEGYTNAEIAARLSCALRTVERRLELIRRIWDRTRK
jgi:DNA-directed RNA polymerase specialized sigma24 family protein